MTNKEVELVLTWFDTDGSSMVDIEKITKQLTGEDCLTRELSLPSLPKPFVNTHAGQATGDARGPTMMSNATAAAKFGLMPGKCELKFESLRKKFLLREGRVHHLQEEKSLIKKKLAEVEVQRKKIMEKHHERHAVHDPFAIRK